MRAKAKRTRLKHIFLVGRVAINALDFTTHYVSECN